MIHLLGGMLWAAKLLGPTIQCRANWEKWANPCHISSTETPPRVELAKKLGVTEPA